MDDPLDGRPRVKISEWYRVSGPLPLYIHKDDPRLAGWREEAKRAFSRLFADIIWRAHIAEHTGEGHRDHGVGH